MSKYYIGTDIGGTTFSSGLFDDSLKLVKTSQKLNIADFASGDELILGIAEQIKSLNEHCGGKIQSAGLACPGPLDAAEGMILDTPNLILFQNYPVAEKLEGQINLPVFIENDANLFAQGEYAVLRDESIKVLTAITLGTGTGFGLIINGQLFTGAHGMGAEYGISPVEWGKWEEGINIKGLEKLSLEMIGTSLSPKYLNDLAREGDKNALKVWDVYGWRVGLLLSHVINMLDPNIISIGGGISHAFEYFSGKMVQAVKEFAPAYTHYKIRIYESTHKELSAMIGAAALAKKSIGNS
ncbi:MAG: ROK family protein [FCB group bacterium]|nr:ROK family protein [FCB group bacterium]